MRSDLNDLAAFAMVAEERSFTRAAGRLGVSQSALSHAMRGLEKRLGLQLLARTTRSVSPTAAGSALLEELAPALERIERSLAEARKLRERPAGRIRLVISRTATQLVLLPKLARFARTYPEILLEVTSSNDPVDLVAGQFDAGIQIGEFIQRDMIAVRVSKDLRLALVGSPEYFKSHSIPRNPRDLKDHTCIGFRFSSRVYRWEFEKGRRALTVNPRGPATFDDPDLVIQAVLNGMGIGMALEQTLRDRIEKGQLVQVLRDWCPVFPGYFLYYPSRRNQSAALSALIDTLRLRD
ncbi:MAG TPA: LysR substrate-binding domain-containing protein [Acidobacteriaceae bacterium]|nr:LysR substrate-binding domain-containing protein [Acidobacteriaceae bacterium]